MKSGNGGWKNKLIEHAEKIILGVTCVLLRFFWSAFRLKPIESSKSPEQLASIRTSAEQKINEGTTQIEPVPPLPPVISTAADATLYKYPQVLDENIEPEIIKRRDPKLYPATDLRGDGNNHFRSRHPRGNSTKGCGGCRQAEGR